MGRLRSQRRQSLIVWLAAAAVSAVALAAVGCGGNASSGASSAPKADVLKVVQQGGFTTLDPRSSSSQEVFLMANMYEPLLYKNPAGSKEDFRPGLATSWTVSPDAKTWTFQLRKGVKFHDGQPFNAAAVKSSIEATKKLGQGYAYLWDSVKSIDVVDDYTVKFTTTSPEPLDVLLSSQYGAWIFSPAVDNKPSSWFDKGNDAGTGPYTMKTYDPQNQVVLAGNPSYWGGWQDNQYKDVVISIVPDTQTERQMLESGQADYQAQGSREDVAQMKTNPDIHVAVLPSYLNYWMYLNTQRKPFDDLRVRQALTYATPYEDILQVAGAGLGNVSAGPLPKTLYPHDDSLQPPTYDIAKAKQLLTDAGYANGFKMTLTFASNEPLYPKIAGLVKESYAKIGVTLNIQPLVWNTAWSKAKGPASQRQDALIITWWPGFASGADTLRTAFMTEKTPSWNLSYWYNPEFDKIVTSAWETQPSDPEKAQQLYNQAQQMIVDDCPVIVYFDDVNIQNWSNKLSVNQYAIEEAYPQAVFFYNISLR
jgi:peptide/nickel transport system substrate-binding protein